MMGFNPQKKQMVFAIAIAVMAALGLAVTVTFGFSSTVSTTTNTTNTSSDCTHTNPPMLSLPPNSTLKEEGTTVIGGTTYSYVSFIEGNLNTVNFHGVTFAFNDFLLPSPPQGGYVSIVNATMLRETKTTNSSGFGGLGGCMGFLPQITITFGDGSSVVYNRATVTVTAVSANETFDKPSSNPWFTQHTAPQAGVAYQTNGGEITLYVST